MNQQSTLIYELKGLKKSYNKQTVLNIGRLQFHRGTIYGVIGPIGSGKSTLLNIMAGLEKETHGTLKYDMNQFETNWLGNIKSIPEIQYYNSDIVNKNIKVSSLLNSNNIKNVSQYFKNGSLKLILEKNIRDLSKGEVAYLNMVMAINSDPRVLLIDDYALNFDKNMELDFRKKLIRMNKELGTTILLSAPNDQCLKLIASVMIYLDNGHISKIRSGAGKSPRPYTKRPVQKKNVVKKRFNSKQKPNR
jgi:ABC-type multidrug transport system ATPase subunit